MTFETSTARPRQHAVVTGGTLGIGAAICRALAAEGFAVTLGARDGEAAEALAVELFASGAQATGAHLDVTDPESFAVFLADAQDQHGPIDVFIANAGVMCSGSFDEEPEAVMRRVFEVDLMAVVRGLKLVYRALRARAASTRFASVASRWAGPASRRGRCRPGLVPHRKITRGPRAARPPCIFFTRSELTPAPTTAARPDPRSPT